MIYEYLKRDKAELVYNDFINNNLNLENLNAFYKNMRKALIEFHEKHKDSPLSKESTIYMI